MRVCLITIIAVIGLVVAAEPGHGEPSARSERAAAPVPIVFEDVTESVGLSEHVAGWQYGHGGAWGDVTGNGQADLYIGAFASRHMFEGPDGLLPNMLLLNEGDRFTLSPDESVRFDYRHQPRDQPSRLAMALFVDLNNNGKLDLLAGTHAGIDSRLFENRWPDDFRNVTPDKQDDRWPHGLHMRNASAIDLNRNGLLDLVLIDGRYRGNDQRVIVMRNLGDFEFENVSDQYGFPAGDTRGLGSAIGDVNNNGRLDLFVPDANRMFISRDDGTYTEYRPGFFALPEGYSTEDWPCGAAFADLTGNGLLDLVYTVHGESREDRPSPGQVYLFINRGIDNEGMPKFEDVTHEAGLHIVLPPRGTTGLVLKAAQLALVDLDNSGRRDILMGMVREDDDGRLQPVLFHNMGVNDDGVPQFEVPPLESVVGYYATAPVADYDRDGRIDIFMATWFPELDNILFRNVTDAGHYLLVSVEGAADDLNRMGIGATLRLYATGHAGDDDHLLSRSDITIGNGYSSGDEAIAHFGLGTRELVDLRIDWQGYQVTLTDVAADQHLVVPIGVEH